MTKKRRDKTEEFDDVIDLTPMVNVSLVLVIVFMCISPMAIVTGVKAFSSKSSGVSIGKTSKSDIVKILLKEDKTIFINNIKVDRRKLESHLKDVIAFSKVKEVMITAAKNNLVEDVVHLMDISKQYGAEKVVISN